jgi:hypothetical protein
MLALAAIAAFTLIRPSGKVTEADRDAGTAQLALQPVAV